MTRITLLTTNLARGGAEAQVAQLAIELRRREWDVQVASLLPPTAFADELAAAGVPVLSLGMRAGKADPRALIRLARHLRRFRPQVLHAHMFHANLMARLIRLIYPVPVLISTIHSTAETSRAEAGQAIRLSYSLHRRDLLYRFTDRLSDLTVCVCAAVAERHLGAGAVSRARLRIIPNGVDTNRFRPDPGQRARTRDALGLGGQFVWLAAGRLMWKKDYPTMLKAMAKLPFENLLIAGEGPQQDELRALSPANVRFLGPRDDMPQLMNACDALALSSVVEGLPMVLLEAAASGLPAVATVEPASRVAPSGDPDALAAAMAEVAGMPPEARASLAQAARARAVAEYDLGAIVTRWEETYARWGGPPGLSEAGQEAGPTALDVTNRFVLEFARGYSRILDFGCGAGRLVAAGLAAGLDISGADVYYGGSKTREEAQRAGLLGAAVREIQDGRIPFDDSSFDLVVNNQVMEHVEDLDAVLQEIHRVLRPGGAVLSIFPSRDVFREGHIGIPFSHWFARDSRLRFYFTWALRSLGLGTWKEEAPTARQWAVDKLRWLDRYTRYRSRAEIFRVFGRYFQNELRESDYIRYRLLDRPGRRLIADLLRLPPAAAAARAAFRKLAFLVIVSRRVEK